METQKEYSVRSLGWALLVAAAGFAAGPANSSTWAQEASIQPASSTTETPSALSYAQRERLASDLGEFTGGNTLALAVILAVVVVAAVVIIVWLIIPWK